MIVGVDIGGTFTDFVLVDPETGEQRQQKVSSTPANPADAVVGGLRDLGVDLSCYERVIHGTTVATNTVIQRRGARTGLITTGGHRDVLAIRRGNKPEREVFNIRWDDPEPLVPRYLRLDVGERVDAQGRVVVPLNEGEVRLAVNHLVELGVDAVAVCFLFSYLNDAHELRAGELVKEIAPDLEVSLSSRILPQWREYERSATTVADAYVKPVMRRYLEQLANALAEQGFGRDLLIMRSNGGVMTARGAAERPIETFLSGPAGGVVAGLYHGKQVGEPNVITIDIGGTSFDVSLIAGGRFSTTTESWIDDATPLSLAMLDVRSIGAGGGSIAWIDSGGALKVGPLSAGAEPGPACYGRGGTEPTVTDANVVLGRLGAMTLLGGRLAIQEELAREAVSAKVALPLALGVEEAAAGIIRICVANMAAQLKAITAERGVNPRDFVIVAGGGGGPLHAALLAREFEIARVLVPPFPGLLSAGGLILSDLRVDRLRSFRCRIERDGVEGLRVAVERLLEEVEAALRAEGYEGDPVVEVALDMKYTGQNWEISVSIDPAAISVEDVCRRFDQHHDKLYGFSSSAHTHEVLSVRASAIGPNLRAMDFIPRRSLPARADAAAAPGRTRRMWDDDQGTFVEGPLVDRDRLAAGSSVAGPAVIEGMDSTVWVPSGGVASVDEFGNILLDLRRQAA